MSNYMARRPNEAWIHVTGDEVRVRALPSGESIDDLALSERRKRQLAEIEGELKELTKDDFFVDQEWLDRLIELARNEKLYMRKKAKRRKGRRLLDEADEGDADRFMQLGAEEIAEPTFPEDIAKGWTHPATSRMEHPRAIISLEGLTGREADALGYALSGNETIVRRTAAEGRVTETRLNVKTKEEVEAIMRENGFVLHYSDEERRKRGFAGNPQHTINAPKWMFGETAVWKRG